MLEPSEPPPGYGETVLKTNVFRWGPGKSGPRLLQDLGSHNLRERSEALSRFPASLLEDTFSGEQHSWIIDLLHDEEFEDARILRACCELTRLHVELSIDYQDEEDPSMSNHCQVSSKLHHFQLLEEDTVRQVGKYNGFTWACSRCPTTCVIRLRAPEVPEDLLVDLYSIRPQSSFSNPVTIGDDLRPSRYSTLVGLEYLLRNTAQFNPHNLAGQVPREIPYAGGSMFERRVGHERAVVEILKAMMFTFCPADHEPGHYIDEEVALDEIQTDGVEWVFRPANPIHIGVRSKYRRLRLEMQILATKAREDLNDVHRNRPWLVKHLKADSYMRILLDADAKLFSILRNTVVVARDTAEEPSYHKLGVTAEFTDVAIADFYSLQSKHDQPNTSYYLSAIEAIAKKRNSGTLLLELQTQKSMGAYTRQDLRSAYSTLLSSPSSMIDLESEIPYSEEDDETLINIAASIVMDDNEAKHKVRHALEIIAKERDSNEIRKYLQTPERDFQDIPSALRYLGAEEATDDDFLITLYDIKTEENEQLARSALQTIADERKNVRLRKFLDTGDRSSMPSVKFHMPDDSDTQMLDPDLAYSRLGVDDRDTEDDMLIMLYEIRAADDPDEAEALRKALELLGDTRNSKAIADYLATGTKEVVSYKPPDASIERPVGLENIGNTCYLNSLLQYYFTVKALRETILNLDGFLEGELSETVLKRKKVGGRMVTIDEIERAVRFIKELRTLFRSLIASKTASLKPSRAVCFLALVSQRDERLQVNEGPNDTHTSNVITLDKTDGLHLQGTESNQLVLHHEAHPPSISENHMDDIVSDFAGCSPGSNIFKPTQAGGIPHDNHQDNTSPMNLDNPISDQADDKVLLPGLQASFGKPFLSPSAQESNLIDSDPGNNKKLKFTSMDIDVPSPGSSSAPEHVEHLESSPGLIDVPVVPPRKNMLARRQSSLLGAETNDWGRQQDVAECIDNVLFQLEAALRPTSFDPNGEQVDLVKDLFYGVTKQTLSTSTDEPKLERFSNTIVTLENDGQDIYQALDGVFDHRLVELGGNQVSLDLKIAAAPPILQIQIQRVGFDLKSMSAVKSNLYLALDQSLYLDRYLETSSQSMIDKRAQHYQWKQELAALSQKRNELQNLHTNIDMVGPEHNDHLWSATENEVSSEDESEETQLENLRRGSVREIGMVQPEPVLSKEELELELKSNEAEQRDLSFKIAHAFDDHQSHEYYLHSVFIHRGEASHGHYWVYIYDFTRDKWRKYNDEEVSDVNKEEVFRDRTGDNENPYMLSYVKADRLDLTGSLERDMDKTWEEESLL